MPLGPTYGTHGVHVPASGVGDVPGTVATQVPGSYKADLFRYCILWSDGGVYGDLAHRYHVPLHELVDFERDDLVRMRARLGLGL